MYFIFCKFSAPTIEYVSHLSYLPLEDLEVFWRAEVFSLPISQIEVERLPTVGENEEVPGQTLDSLSGRLGISSANVWNLPRVQFEV